MSYPRRMRARINSSCPGCGELIRVGNMILLFSGDELWICHRCAILRQAEQPQHATSRRGEEQLLADPKIKALLCKALVTDSPPEALACLTKARELHIAKEKVPV
jgi:hypothetical protein